MGRLTRDPEVRYSSGERSMAIARYSIAVDRRGAKEGEQTARYVDIMNSFYGHTGIPMARARDNGGDGTEIEEAYTSQVCALTAEDGTPIFATAGVDYENLPDGHILYRKLLSEQPDSSVVIVSVGFLTNLEAFETCFCLLCEQLFVSRIVEKHCRTSDSVLSKI